MDMMNRIIITVQSAAIPILAVIMAVIVFNMMKSRGLRQRTAKKSLLSRVRAGASERLIPTSKLQRATWVLLS